MGSYTAPPIEVKPSYRGERAELVFGGVEQAGPSFEARVFLDNPGADATTAQAPETGYVGSFHVFGYGSPAPPAIAEAQARREEGDPPVAPIEKRVGVAGPLLRSALERSNELTVTVVSVPADPGGPTPQRPFESLDLVFEPAGGKD
jgi:hypothetical protein